MAGFAVAAFGAGLTAACSLAYQASANQCSVDIDCTARGSRFAGSVCRSNVCVTAPADAGTSEAGIDSGIDSGPYDYTCLGHVTNPPVTSAKYTLTVPYIDIETSNPIVGIHVTACSGFDPACASAVADAAVTDEAGVVSFQVPSGYFGYLLSTWDAGPAALVYPTKPVFKNELEEPEQMITTQVLDLVASSLAPDGGTPVTIDPTKGILFLSAYDCTDDAGAPGVVFSVTPASAASKSVAVYLAGGFPNPTAQSTDPSGGAAIVNVDAVQVTVTAKRVVNGQEVGKATGYVSAGHITFLNVPPTPY
jgi:hypothetical protein